MKFSVNYKNILIVIIVSSALGLVFNSFSPTGIKIIREADKVVETDSEDYSIIVSDGIEIKTVESKSAYKFFLEEDYIFVDSRDQWDYEDGHIKGAINIPQFSFEPDNETLSKLDKSTNLVIYCDGNDCDVSKRLAKEFIKLGYNFVFVYLGGYMEWATLGFPIE